MGLKENIEFDLQKKESILIHKLYEFIEKNGLTNEQSKKLMHLVRGYYLQGLEVLDSGKGTDFSRYSMTERLDNIEKEYQ